MCMWLQVFQLDFSPNRVELIHTTGLLQTHSKCIIGPVRIRRKRLERTLTLFSTPGAYCTQLDLGFCGFLLSTSYFEGLIEMVFAKNGLGFFPLLRGGLFLRRGSAFCWRFSSFKSLKLFLTTCWAHSKCILSPLPATIVSLLLWQFFNWLLNHFLLDLCCFWELFLNIIQVINVFVLFLAGFLHRGKLWLFWWIDLKIYADIFTSTFTGRKKLTRETMLDKYNVL